MKMFFFSLFCNLCYMFYCLRTVFWRGRLHQFMILLLFFIKKSYFWYFLAIFAICFQICCPKRVMYSYIFWIYWKLDILYILKSENHKKKRASHNTCFLRFLENILRASKEIIFSKQPKETVKNLYRFL